MKPTTPLLLLSLGATTTLARNHNNTDTSPTSQCHRLARLTSLAALASDPAALAAAAKSPSDAEELQAKAAAAAPELAALRGNETFVAMCAAQVNGTTAGTGGGWGGDWDDCKKLEKLREKVMLGVNATTATEGAEGGMRGAKWAAKLKTLEGNGTLVAECAAKSGGGSGSGGAGGKSFSVVKAGSMSGVR